MNSEEKELNRDQKNFHEYENLPDQHLKRPGKQEHMDPEPLAIRRTYKAAGKLIGKIALITGGDSGIGRSIAVHYAHEGANVVIVYNESDEDAQHTKSLVETLGMVCLCIKGDLSSAEFCKECIQQTVATFGTVNVLVNNAGTQYPVDDFQKASHSQILKTFEVNVFPLFYLTQEALQYMQSGDCIINTTSITSYRGHKLLVDYSSSKGAITSFTRALSAHLAEKNIRVNAVAPGPIWTPLIPATFENTENFGKDTPMGRAGDPAEVAPAFVFLASEDSSYITGQTIHINGGHVIGG